MVTVDVLGMVTALLTVLAPPYIIPIPSPKLSSNSSFCRHTEAFYLITIRSEALDAAAPLPASPNPSTYCYGAARVLLGCGE